MRRLSKLMTVGVSAAAVLLSGGLAAAQLANLKVVTDASPDFSDMESMVHSITSRWETDQDKMWALFYWDHKARRQTSPMQMHGKAMTDPIMQYNDFGFLMCSTISGLKCSVWNYMGYPSKYYDIAVHTVPEVWFDGRWNHYDNSLSIYYTLCDGETVAGIQDIGNTLGCEASGGKEEPGHIAIYHAVNGTSVNGFIEGSDTMRDLKKLGTHTYQPGALKYRWYYYDQERGHRYILNLRENEVYTRHYSRQDVDSPDAVQQRENRPNYTADPAYFVPIREPAEDGQPLDPESQNPRYTIRGNGLRTFKPILTNEGLVSTAHQVNNIRAVDAAIQPASAGQSGEAIFKIEGANIITSMTISADARRASANDAIRLAISSDNGMTWTEIWSAPSEGDNRAEVKLIDGVNGFHEVLVKATLLAANDPAGAQLRNIEFETITMLNSKTQPQLNIGKNTVYVSAGEQTGSIVLWPELQKDRYKPYVVEEQGIRSKDRHPGYNGVLTASRDDEDRENYPGHGYVVFRVDSPKDITRITQGARMYVRARNARVDFEHSFDNGQTWHKSYSFTDTNPPWDDIHHQVTEEIPAGTRSVLFKYALNQSSLFSVRMEVNHELASPVDGPVEVTFNWSERQQDYSLVERSHTQLVESLPATYEINVGGYDHPVVNSLTVNLAGAHDGVIYGYSDGVDVGGEKWIGQWATYGRNLAVGKPYTVSVPSETNWGAGDPDGTKLTDGRVGSSYSGGTSYSEGLIWPSGSNPEVVVDLGEPQQAAAFRIHVHGYRAQDAILGQVEDEVEVLTSLDGENWTSHGNFDFNLYWKDIPVNYMWTDEETFKAHNHLLLLDEPVDARYVKYSIKPSRLMAVTEVQVLDGVKFDSFDLKIALPDPDSHGQFPPPANVSPNARQFAPHELPTDVGKDPRQS